MPLEGAKLADYCGEPMSVCSAARLDCDTCKSWQKEEALERFRAGKTIVQEMQERKRERS